MRNVIISLLLIFPYFAQSQKHDYVWITGDDNQTLDTTYGGSLIDFNFNPVKAKYNYRKQNMFTTNSSICDTAGNLLFFTNGCEIAGDDDETLENGDNINPGSTHTLWCDNYNDGYAGGPQNSVILPLPDSSGLYYLFHKRYIIYSNPVDIIFDKLYYSIVDMNQNNGKGKVITKNVEFMSDTLSQGGICAIKHGNGKDWWLITARRNSNVFYTFKFTKEGVVDTFQQTIGIMANPAGESLGQIVASPDGEKIYRTNRYDPVMVYTFDREVGVFTQFDTIPFAYGNQLVGEIGCAVSPSGRFLYLGCRKFLYQLDLWATDISASQTTVAEWDGVTTPIPTLFYQLQLGPDCKIYGLAGGDTQYYHVIHNPDEQGLGCNVEQRGLLLPARSGASMPSFPNYRLGSIDNPGVPCTATVSAAPPPAPAKNKVQVWPNPASEEITVSYTLSQSKGENRLLFTDLYGCVVHETLLQGASGRVEVSVSSWAAGVYFFTLAGAEKSLSSGKIIVQH